MNGIASDMPDSARTDSRESIFLSARVQFATIRDAAIVRIRNISSGGMMVDCEQPVGPGELLDAEIKNIGRVRGRVAWRTDNRMGIAFDYPIDPKKARVKSGHKEPEARYSNIDFGGARPGLALR